MTDVYALCERGEIEICVDGGVARVEAWRLDPLAVNFDSTLDLYSVTHLPSGQSFGSIGYFKTERQAVSAMVDLIRIGFDWKSLDRPGMPTDLLAQIQAVFRRHQSVSRDWSYDELVRHSFRFSTDLNADRKVHH